MKKSKSLMNRLIIVNLCLAIVLAITAGSLAAYTSMSSAKRVVSTIGAKQLFSSNVLSSFTEGSSLEEKVLTLSNAGDSSVYRITICNFAQGDKTTWSTVDINYDLEVQLLDLAGNIVNDSEVLSAYKIGDRSFATLTSGAKLSGTLMGNSAKEQEYLLTIPAQYMNQYKIMVIAHSNIDQYDPIGKVFTISESKNSVSWSGSFLSNEEAQTDTYELGAINYVLTGQEHANLTLTWNPAYVTLDPWFINDCGATITTDGEGNESITFEVGGVDALGNIRPNQYNVVFYRTRAVNENSGENWERIKNCIHCTSIKIENGGGAG